MHPFDWRLLGLREVGQFDENLVLADDVGLQSWESTRSREHVLGGWASRLMSGCNTDDPLGP